MDRKSNGAFRFVALSPLLDGHRNARRTTPAILAVFLVLALVVGLGRATSAVLYGPFSIDKMPPLVENVVYNLVMYVPALALLFLWVRFYERREVISLIGKKNRFIVKAFRGVVVGVTLEAGTVVVLAIAGATTFEGQSSGATGIAALGGVLAASILVWALPAAAEETIARGWLLQDLGVRRGAATAVVVSALTFAAWHWLLDTSLGLLPVANLVLAGVFWALYALKEGSLVGVCFAHAAYNWAETNLFGFDFYGGEPAGGSLINLIATGPDVLTGGGVGLNTTGGLAFTLVQLVAIALLLSLARSKV